MLRAEVAFLVNRHEETAWAVIRARAIDPTSLRSTVTPVDLHEVIQRFEAEGMFAAVTDRAPDERPIAAEERAGDDANGLRSIDTPCAPTPLRGSSVGCGPRRTRSSSG